LKILKGHTYWVLYLGFNHAGLPINSSVFRKSIAYALNLTDVVSRSTGLDAAIVGNPGFLPPYSPWYNPNVPKYEYNPSKALELLNKINIKDIDGDRVLELPTGKDLVLKLITIRNLLQGAEIIKEYLECLGIKVELRVYDSYYKLDQISRSDNYDLMLTGHGAVGNDSMGFIWYFSAWRVKPWYNDTYNQLVQQLPHAKSKQDVNNIIRQLQAIIAENIPQIPIYYPESYVVSRPEVIVNWYFTYMGANGGYHRLSTN